MANFVVPAIVVFFVVSATVLTHYFYFFVYRGTGKHRFVPNHAFNESITNA